MKNGSTGTDIRIDVPKPIRAVLDLLNAGGYEAYAVGGCIRDALSGREPNDWDICTSALPEETKAVFKGFRVIETGIQHGTVTVLSDGEPCEITTYRVDGSYSDGRHPDAVSFTRCLREDLARRDFTVNAMAYAPSAGLEDPFHGRDDLRDGLLRCVGEPEKRFTEDALRILRAIRFSAVLGYQIHPDTARAAAALRDKLKMVSPERRLVELRKLLVGKNAEAVCREYTDILSAAIHGLPEDSGRLNAEAIGSAPAREDVRFALLLKGTDAGALLRNLRAENALIERVAYIAGLLGKPTPTEPAGVKRMLRDAPEDTVRAAILANGEDCALLDAVLRSGEAYRIDMLAVRGADLIAVGIPAGQMLGRTLRHLLEQVIDGVLPNERDTLLTYAKEFNEKSRSGGKRHGL